MKTDTTPGQYAAVRNSLIDLVEAVRWLLERRDGKSLWEHNAIKHAEAFEAWTNIRGKITAADQALKETA